MPQTPDTSFADDLKSVRGAFDADLQSVREHVDAGKPVPHPLVAKILDWLPTVEGAAGSLLGSVGGVPGRAVGAALGGAAGEAHRQLGNRLAGNPAPATSGEAASAIATEGGKQLGYQVLGEAAAPLMASAGERLMTSAVKPAYAMTERAVKNVELPRVVKTLLDEGVNVTQAGIGKINSLLKATNDEIKNIIANSTATISPAEVARTAVPTIRGAANQVAGRADTEAARGVVREFVADHALDPVTKQMRQMPVQEAQALKQGTYKALSQRAYGETKGAATEAEKALARGLKEGIERAHPEVKGLNAREGALIEAKDAIAKRVALAANRDPAGIGWLAENPHSFVAFLLSRSPAAKSLLARGLYKSAEKATGVPENLIRFGVQALVSSRGQETEQ